jgi:dipeptidyl aminopeptidase/acylaminoacyl peptidase
VLEGGRYATETDGKPYPWEQKFGRDVEDVWVTDVVSGARTKVLAKVRYVFGGDPTGTRIAWADGKDYWITDLATGARTNLTATLTKAGADFVDHDDDHPTDIPHIFPIAGWSKGGTALLVNDTHDVWRLALDGSGGVRLTDGATADVRHRLVNFAPQGASTAERAFDLTAPQYFALFGRHSKQAGFARRSARGTVERLVLADAAYRSLVRADSVNTVAFIRSRYDESPDVYVGADPVSAMKVTATNPFQANYAWGKVELMNFTSSIGVPLQALLYYPANYDASKKYPLIVYTYERLTDGLHGYVVPNQTNYYNTTVFTQQGYFVLMPDIVFRPREPGLAAQQAVEPAVSAVIGRGLVDPARVGHVGHSQGGYEAAFLGTHSKMFATTVVGSGITDMVSFAGQLHWSGGSAEFDHWETGQFRMEVAPWEDEGAMRANSPLATVQNMPAKAMLLEIGGDDGTVDPRQGSLFYNYARRAGKNVVLLTYPGEGHGLQKKENQADYQLRILQWFAHYLKGEPAAPWIVNGQTALERRAVLEANT